MPKKSKGELVDKNLVAFRDWVRVKPVEKGDSKTPSGLLRPDNTEEEPKACGKIESVGDDVEKLKVGMTVLHGAFAGETVKVLEKGKEVSYVFIKEEDVIAIVE